MVHAERSMVPSNLPAFISQSQVGDVMEKTYTFFPACLNLSAEVDPNWVADEDLQFDEEVRQEWAEAGEPLNVRWAGEDLSLELRVRWDGCNKVQAAIIPHEVADGEVRNWTLLEEHRQRVIRIPMPQ